MKIERVSDYEVRVGDTAIVTDGYDGGLRVLSITDLEAEREAERLDHKRQLAEIEARNVVYRETRDRIARHVSAAALREWEKRQSSSYRVNKALKTVWTKAAFAEQMAAPSVLFERFMQQ